MRDTKIIHSPKRFNIGERNKLTDAAIEVIQEMDLSGASNFFQFGANASNEKK